MFNDEMKQVRQIRLLIALSMITNVSRLTREDRSLSVSGLLFDHRHRGRAWELGPFTWNQCGTRAKSGLMLDHERRVEANSDSILILC